MLRFVVLAGFSPFLVSLCSSSNDGGGGVGGGGGSAGGGNVSCAGVTQTCVKMPIGEVNAVSGSNATFTTPYELGEVYSHQSGCQYVGIAGAEVEIARDCFFDGPAAMQDYYDLLHDKPLEAEQSIEELDGIGEGAFIRYDDAEGTAKLYTKRDSVLVTLTGFNVVDHGDSKSGLADLALVVLKLHQ